MKKTAKLLLVFVLMAVLLSAGSRYGKAESAGATPNAANLVPNPSFEVDTNGDRIPDHWSSIGTGTAIYMNSRLPHTGVYCLYINPGNPDGGARSDAIPISPGTYEFNAYVSILRYASQRLEIRDASTDELIGTLALGPAPKMTKFRTTVAIPVETSAVYIYAHGLLFDTVFLDDVYLSLPAARVAPRP